MRVPAQPASGPAVGLDAGVTEVRTTSAGEKPGLGYGGLLDRLWEESAIPVPGANEHENLHSPANKGGGARGPAEVVVSMVQHGSAEPEGESDPQPREHHGMSPPSPGEHVWEIFAKTGVAWSPRHSGEGSEVRGWGWVWSVSGARGSMCIRRG